MSKNKGKGGQRQFQPQKPQRTVVQQPPLMSVLDKMIDDREFESLLNYKFINVNIVKELRDSINEIKSVRGNPIVCYVANVVTQVRVSTSIDNADDLPFSEMVSMIPAAEKEIDVVLVTPGGSANQVSKFINQLRPRFDKVNFIILNMCMSAGTIFVVSGDDIIMNKSSHIGPIDPQVHNRVGRFVPAQALLNLVDEIKKRGNEAINTGQPPAWTDLEMLRSIDPKEIGSAISASNYSIMLVENHLFDYKFKSWTQHTSTNGNVTDIEKRTRAKEIAALLCNHAKWNSHAHAITREDAWNVCQLKITHAEDIGLDRSMKRMWALFYWVFENTSAAKIFVSENYCIIRNDLPTPANK